ncbi:hypothetical protein [uncultured Xanthomonas sp.]|uniref:hypothetical protein n=1 Tax=uncultured Xanthomonas sp. TaxID=152831 RepID=UPI0025DF0C57|nr:hypothetical protein [uncultured Xanthomonas sp.]
MRPHRVLTPARVALLGPRTTLAAAPHRTAGALRERLQPGDLAAVETDLHRYAALNHGGIVGTGAPGPAACAAPGHVDPALIADVAAWVRALPASHGATP